METKKRKRLEDLCSNEKNYPTEPKPILLEEDFEDWLKQTKLQEKELNILKLTHAAALDDLAAVTRLLQQQVAPTQICPIKAGTAMSSSYIRYLGSSPFHWACSDQMRDLLCGQASQIKIIDKDGFTPLMRCIINNNIIGVKYWCAKNIYARENPFLMLKLALEKDRIFDYLVFVFPRIEELSEVEKLENKAKNLEVSNKVKMSLMRMRKDLTCLPHGGVPEEPKAHTSIPSDSSTTGKMATRSSSAFFERPSEYYMPTQIIEYENEGQKLEFA